MTDTGSLTTDAERLAHLSPAKRALLERALMQRTAAAVRVPRRTGDGPAPAAFAQRGMWFLERLEPGSGLNTAREALRLAGRVDVGAFRRALDAVVQRHSVLRTTFAEHDGEPVQIVAASGSVSLPLIDLSALPAAERDAALRRLRSAEAEWQFDLTAGPLVRAILVRTGAAEHVLLLSLHHIVADGWSYALLVKELSECYSAACRGEAPAPAEPNLQFADYADWQNRQVHTDALRAQLDWWKAQLSGAPDVLDLAAARPRPAARDHRGGIAEAVVPEHVAAGLRAVARDAGATVFMTLLAAFQTLLYRWSGQTDVVVGCPVAGRRDSGLEGVIGCFVNTLALRTDLSGDPDFAEVLSRVRETTLAAQGHQDVPFELLVEELRVPRDTSRNPVFQTMFAFQNTPPVAWGLPGVEVSSIGLTHPPEAFDLSLSMGEGPEGLTATLSYSTDLFDEAVAERMLADLNTLLSDAAARSSVPISALGPLAPLPAAVPAAVPPGDTPSAPSAPSAGAAGADGADGALAQTVDLLRGIWADVLGADTVGADTDFFAVGGHSLLVVKVISRVRQTFGVDLPLKTVFEASTLDGFAQRVGEALRTRTIALPPVRSEVRDGPIPLSHAQRRLWFQDQLDGGAAHNRATVLTLDGPLDAAALSRAADVVRARHGSLRTVFRRIDGTPCQVVAPFVSAGVTLIDLAGLGASEADRAADRLAEAEAAQPFDLAVGPPLRMRLVRLTPTRHLLLVTLHHIVTDAWSSDLFFDELWQAYTALLGGGPALPSALPVQYTDYSIWEQRTLDAVTQRCADYWRGQLAGAPDALDLPYDRPLSSTPWFGAARLSYELTPERTREVLAFCLRERVTVFMAALAAYLIVLHRHTSQDDLVVGCGVANRETVEAESVIGFFTNQVALRVAVRDQDSVRDVLARVRETTLGAHAHAALPFDRLVELLRPPRRPHRPPLFHVEIEHHRQSDTVGGPPGVVVTSRDLHAPLAAQDLSLHVVETESVVRGVLVYNADAFAAGTARRLLGEFQAALAALVADPDATVGQAASAAEAEYGAAASRERASAARAGFDRLRRRSGGVAREGN